MGARQSGQRLHSVDQQRYSFICGGRDDDGTGALKRYPKKSFHWYRDVIASRGAAL